MKKLHVLGNRVLLEEIKCKQEIGDIVLPETVQQKPTKFKVIDIGDDVLDLKVGDNVIIDTYTGTEIKQEDVVYRIVEEEEILAIVD